MPDLIERLRNRRESVYDYATQGAEWQDDALCSEAASRITALEKENAELLAEEAAKVADKIASAARIQALEKKVERLRRTVEFVQLWAWRDDPLNANNKLTDEERFSAIKWHPQIQPRRRSALRDGGEK